ncbi:MAG: four helix bundle protein [Candidatus Paceibacterota bacterium]|jgi:four helix bundle protein
MEKIRTFKDLNAWKKSHELVIKTYLLTKNFPKEELFGIVNQMRRAAVSIPSNIAEGFSRNSYKEKVQFYSIARGSLTELESQCLIARDLHYIASGDYSEIEDMLLQVNKILSALISSSRRFS